MPEAKQTLSQKRAAHALQRVGLIEASQDIERADKYATHLQGVPATILYSGLGQALALLLAKGTEEKHRKDIYDDLQDWLCHTWEDRPQTFKDGQTLMKAITQSSEAEYLLAHVETLEYLGWLKKFATAFLKKPKKSNTGQTVGQHPGATS
jgi:CRISPR-associated protein Cmr5